MTTAFVSLRSRVGERLAARTRVRLPPLGHRLELARVIAVMIGIVAGSLAVELVVVSSLQQRAAQERSFARFRDELARGIAPVGPTDSGGRVLALGAPVALLEIPSLGLRQVVVEGTSPAALFTGPGHRRDSPLPGQAGVSVVLGRRAAFGGPFSRLHELREGAAVTVTTGQGRYEYRVTGLRREGDPAPDPVGSGRGRLLLATADGSPFLPSGVLRVDADLTTPADPGPRPLLDNRSLPASEQMMATDSRTLWALALWLQALTAVVVGFLWTWQCRSPAKAWLIFTPPALLAGLFAAGEAARLLPNLL